MNAYGMTETTLVSLVLTGIALLLIAAATAFNMMMRCLHGRARGPADHPKTVKAIRLMVWSGSALSFAALAVLFWGF